MSDNNTTPSSHHPSITHHTLKYVNTLTHLSPISHSSLTHIHPTHTLTPSASHIHLSNRSKMWCREHVKKLQHPIWPWILLTCVWSWWIYKEDSWRWLVIVTILRLLYLTVRQLPAAGQGISLRQQDKVGRGLVTRIQGYREEVLRSLLRNLRGIQVTA